VGYLYYFTTKKIDEDHPLLTRNPCPSTESTQFLRFSYLLKSIIPIVPALFVVLSIYPFKCILVILFSAQVLRASRSFGIVLENIHVVHLSKQPCANCSARPAPDAVGMGENAGRKKAVDVDDDVDIDEVFDAGEAVDPDVQGISDADTSTFASRSDKLTSERNRLILSWLMNSNSSTP
jgi:hypothetical protein